MEGQIDAPGVYVKSVQKMQKERVRSYYPSQRYCLDTGDDDFEQNRIQVLIGEVKNQLKEIEAKEQVKKIGFVFS